MVAMCVDRPMREDDGWFLIHQHIPKFLVGTLIHHGVAVDLVKKDHPGLENLA